jgi:hypothetical protein
MAELELGGLVQVVLEALGCVREVRAPKVVDQAV